MTASVRTESASKNLFVLARNLNTTNQIIHAVDICNFLVFSISIEFLLFKKNSRRQNHQFQSKLRQKLEHWLVGLEFTRETICNFCFISISIIT